jgi:hypothetical protein
MTYFAKTPKFLFERRPDIESAHDWLLAGYLTVDVPKKPVPPAKRHRPVIDAIVAELMVAAQMGDLPDDGVTLGGTWPWNADADEGVLRAWIARSLTVMLRVMVCDDGNTRAEIRVPYEVEDEPEPKRPTVH